MSCLLFCVIYTQLLYMFLTPLLRAYIVMAQKFQWLFPLLRFINYDTHNFYLISCPSRPPQQHQKTYPKKKHISPSSSLTCNMKRTAAKLYLFLIIKRYLYRITFTICVLAGGRASRDAEQEQREGSKKYHCDIYANAIYYKRI